MAFQKDSKIAWGISMVIFGILFFIRELRVLPQNISDLIFDFKNYPIILGLVFLLAHKNKTIGLVLVAVGLLFRISDIIRWTENISDFIWPVLLLIAGFILIFGSKSKK